MSPNKKENSEATKSWSHYIIFMLCICMWVYACKLTNDDEVADAVIDDWSEYYLYFLISVRIWYVIWGRGWWYIVTASSIAFIVGEDDR